MRLWGLGMIEAVGPGNEAVEPSWNAMGLHEKEASLVSRPLAATG